MTPRLVTASGALALETVLLGELEGLLPTCAEELEPPVRIVVPSKSLRYHLSSRLVQWRGRALAGVVVQTLYATALEICERAGQELRVSDAVYEVLARRLAADETSLRDGLGFLDDGYAVVTATTRDLLDAGFEPALVEPLLDQLGSLAGALPMQVIERAAALVRVAGAMAGQAEELDASRTSDLLRLANDHLKRDPDRVLPSRAVVIYGYADATGTVLDLLETMTRSRAALVLMDRPPDPVDHQVIDAGAVFSQPFLERLSGTALPEEGQASPQRVVLSGHAAPTRDDEVREVAMQLRDLLDTGRVAPEAVAVVARDLRGYTSALRRSFDRFAIPFSALGGSVAAGERRRRVNSLVALLQRRHRLPADRWLEVVAGPEHRHELLAGLRALGTARLGDVAGIATGRSKITVLEPTVLEPTVPEPLSSEQLSSLVRRAAVCCELLAGWPSQASGGEHRAATMNLLETLGWSDDDDWLQSIAGCVSGLAGLLPPDWPISDDEWVQLLAGELERLTQQPLAGRGGGVQVLNVMEARGRTFEVLFLLGLARDVFPRVIREDPLLPDTVRGRLAVVLPDIPVKARGWAEERFLFAQLLAAAPRVHLSWFRSDRGQPVAPSPFVERLRLEAGLEPLQPAAADQPERCRPAFEQVIAAGLGGDRQAWAAILQAAFEEGRGRAQTAAVLPAAVDPLAVAFRRALLDEVDPPRRRNTVSPFAGLVGSSVLVWPGSLVITNLEQMARCPWQTFVTRILEVRPMPDPLLELPDADPRLVGTLVHRVLQRIIQEEIGDDGAGLHESLLRLPVEVPWPSDTHLEALLARESEDLALLEGFRPARPGLGAMLAEVARPYLEMARRTEWQAGRGTVPAVGAEVSGSRQVAGRIVAFRADRVDFTDHGPRLSDYKTSRNPVASRRSPERRRQRLQEEVERGRMLQAVLYVLAAGGSGAIGRYCYLRPDDSVMNDSVMNDSVESNSVAGGKGGVTELCVTAEDQELVAAFDRAMAVIIAAVGEGSFFPRLEEAGSERQGGWCRSCRVREACQRNDSAFRRRLVAWMDRSRPPAPHDDLHPAEAAAAELWWLGHRDTEEQDG